MQFFPCYLLVEIPFLLCSKKMKTGLAHRDLNLHSLNAVLSVGRLGYSGEHARYNLVLMAEKEASQVAIWPDAL